MNFITQTALLVSAAFIPTSAQIIPTLIEYDDSYIEKINLISLFKKNQEKLNLANLSQPAAFKRYAEALQLIFDSELDYKIGIEFTKKNTIFITSIVDEIDSEMHIELYFNKDKKDTFFAFYTGEDMTDMGIYSFTMAKSKIKKSFSDTKNTTPIILI